MCDQWRISTGKIVVKPISIDKIDKGIQFDNTAMHPFIDVIEEFQEEKRSDGEFTIEPESPFVSAPLPPQTDASSTAKLSKTKLSDANENNSSYKNPLDNTK